MDKQRKVRNCFGSPTWSNRKLLLLQIFVFCLIKFSVNSIKFYILTRYILHSLLSKSNGIWKNINSYFAGNEMEHGTNANTYRIHLYPNEIEYRTNANPYIAFRCITMKYMEQMPNHILHSFVSKLNEICNKCQSIF